MAIIVFLAHIGCPVPATMARIGLVDKIFTRLLSEETVALRQSAFLIDLTQVLTVFKISKHLTRQFLKIKKRFLSSFFFIWHKNVDYSIV